MASHQVVNMTIPCDSRHLVLALQKISDCVRPSLRDIKDPDLKLLLVDLLSYSILVRHHLNRFIEAGSSVHINALHHQFSDQLAFHLSLPLSPARQTEHNDCDEKSNRPAMNARSQSFCTKNEPAKYNFIWLAFDLEKGNERLQTLVDALKVWETDVRRQFPEDQSSQITEDLARTKSTPDPSPAIRKAARSLSEALLSCQACGCLPEHHYGASLPLGTHRAPAIDDIQNSITFDMFLVASDNWHEVRMHTIRAKSIRFDDEVGDGSKPTTRQARDRTQHTRPVRIVKLCDTLHKATNKSLRERLEFRVDKGNLYKLHSRRHTTLVDIARSPVSLEQCLREQPHAFSEKIKRILSVVLSYSVLYLHDTPWLQSRWGSADIVFFQTSSSQIPLRPYLRANLSNAEGSSAFPASHNFEPTNIQDQSSSPGDLDGDDLLEHPYPAVVTLAMTLLEIYFAQPFDELANRFSVEMDEQPSMWLCACDVFDRCKHEIPGDSRLLYAADQCLNQSLWQDEKGNRLDSQSIATTIFEEVVLPLQIDLENAYRYISIQELDQYMQELDLSDWSQAIRTEAQKQSETLIQGKICAPPTSSNSINPPAALVSLPSVLYTQENALNRTLSPSADRTFEPDSWKPSTLPWTLFSDRIMSKNLDYSAHRFYDDETTSSGQILELKNEKYIQWQRDYQAVYAKFITDHSGRISSSIRIKIAILDTGIDLNHVDIQANNERFKGRADFVRGVNSRGAHNTSDLEGHGTFVADLMLQYAPDADIFVARVAEKELSTPQIIAKAILHAITVWKVDIINMSFGFPSRDIDGYGELERALKQAAYEDVLVFAAASNSGGRLGRAYPAREDNVICVNSTDSLGNRSSFSPTADGLSLATVGEAVTAAWPSHLCKEGSDDDSACKSGTSFATPIMVGMASMLLLYARLHLPPARAVALKQKQRMEKVLRRVATKTQGTSLRGGYHFVDMSLHGDSLFGKDKDYIDSTIEDILRY